MNTQLLIPAPTIKKHCTIQRIGIFGSADINEDHPVYRAAYDVSYVLAEQGKIIVNGGGPGVMAAATIGAEAAGGDTIAVTFQPKDMPEFEGRYAGNHPDLEIKTQNYIERMFGLIEESDAYVIFQGGTGTLSEWSTVWLLAHLHYGNHKPLVLFGDFWPDFMEVVNKYFYIGEKETQIYAFANTPEEVVQRLHELEHQLAERCQLPARE